MSSPPPPLQQLKVNEDIGSDSDEEGQVRNVSHLVLRPPGHTGKAKKGHLIFDAAFESGNLGRVDRISDWEYDLFVRPDVANPRFRFWFNFTVENVQEMQSVLFNFVNLSKGSPLFYEGLTPVVRSTSKPQWAHIPPDNVFYYRCPNHRLRYVLSVSFAFEQEDDVYQFALSYPYTCSGLEQKLNFWEIAAKKEAERSRSREEAAKAGKLAASSKNIKRIRPSKNCYSSTTNTTTTPVVLRREQLGRSLVSNERVLRSKFSAFAGPYKAERRLLRISMMRELLRMLNPDYEGETSLLSTTTATATAVSTVMA